MALGLDRIEDALDKLETEAKKKPASAEGTPDDSQVFPNKDDYVDPEGPGENPVKAFRSHKANAGLYGPCS